jgi:hypothetical protein
MKKFNVNDTTLLSCTSCNNGVQYIYRIVFDTRCKGSKLTSEEITTSLRSYSCYYACSNNTIYKDAASSIEKLLTEFHVKSPQSKGMSNNNVFFEINYIEIVI